MFRLLLGSCRAEGARENGGDGLESLPVGYKSGGKRDRVGQSRSLSVGRCVTSGRDPIQAPRDGLSHARPAP